MPNLIPAQIRGARGMLDWSMLDLSLAADVSVSSVKRLEDGVVPSVPDEIQGRMCVALEAAGIHFLPDDGDGPGMRLRGAIGART